MKKILSLCIMAMVAMNMFAQKDVTTFLGIPVDGSEAAMKQKLQAKGFTLKKEDGEEFLKGNLMAWMFRFLLRRATIKYAVSWFLMPLLKVQRT